MKSPSGDLPDYFFLLHRASFHARLAPRARARFSTLSQNRSVTEDKFPTIRDLRDSLSRLIDAGLGDLPVQIVICPVSTMEAVARSTGGPEWDGTKRALMIELGSSDGRLPTSMVSADYLQSSVTDAH
jgi:hypothetical protein